ncbi:alpha/beta fold hydrolase [Massilia sp. DWR3-1-1]|uniref:alpha/beta fold hydrolase n=1 Tax=Massilia sp. DWR3-1-1 TaxID=2804559 RepID=UPI003CE70019
MNCDQRAIRFNCLGSSMIGIIDLPERPLPRGVLVVAGQPDSRLGAQRQFAMLARALARRGFAVMRFDRRGVGDSEGCDYNDSDVRAAVQEFCQQVPGVREVVLLAPGSGSAIATASACARIDPRVRALLLLDPRRRANAARTAHMLAPPVPAPAPIGAALFWRRSQPPRRGPSSGARLAGLAEQLCAFPGQVLVVAATSAWAGPTPAQAEVRQLRALVERAGTSNRVQIIDDAAPAPADRAAGGRLDGDALRAATCASWMVSW